MANAVWRRGRRRTRRGAGAALYLLGSYRARLVRHEVNAVLKDTGFMEVAKLMQLLQLHESPCPADLPGEMMEAGLKNLVSPFAITRAEATGLVQRGGMPAMPPLSMLWRHRNRIMAHVRVLAQCREKEMPAPPNIIRLTRKGWRFRL